MLAALKNQGVPETYIKIVEEMYVGLESRIITDVIGKYFPIQKGVRQGDPLSPLRFNCALEEIFKNLDWDKKVIKINGEYLNNLRFADDVVLIASKKEELENMIRDLHNKVQIAGLNINLRQKY